MSDYTLKEDTFTDGGKTRIVDAKYQGTKYLLGKKGDKITEQRAIELGLTKPGTAPAAEEPKRAHHTPHAKSEE